MTNTCRWCIAETSKKKNYNTTHLHVDKMTKSTFIWCIFENVQNDSKHIFHVLALYFLFRQSSKHKFHPSSELYLHRWKPCWFEILLGQVPTFCHSCFGVRFHIAIRRFRKALWKIPRSTGGYRIALQSIWRPRTWKWKRHSKLLSDQLRRKLSTIWKNRC